jgi:hypothetical protein
MGMPINHRRIHPIFPESAAAMRLSGLKLFFMIMCFAGSMPYGSPHVARGGEVGGISHHAYPWLI